LELQVFGGAATNSGGGTAPPAPTGLTPTVVSSSQINLSWNASTGATSYNVKRATVSGGPYTTVASGVTGTSYSDTGLSASTTYYYVVSAVNSNGESANSSQVSATTSVGGTPPPVPTGLTPTVVSSNQINLSWNASTGATSYNVKRATVSGGPYTTIATGVTATSYNNTGLTPATTYYYVVSAVNANGESANSSQVSATTTGGGGDVLLSQGHPATAKNSQSGHAPAAGNDGDGGTRWSASSSSFPQWWRVDLGASHTLHSATITWLNSDTRSYKYTIDVSSDDVTYTTVVNQSNRTATGDSTDNFNTTGRYVRITVTGSNGGSASFYECKVMGQ
jgi:cellulose 1,4-beta-cellobiosidase